MNNQSGLLLSPITMLPIIIRRIDSHSKTNDFYNALKVWKMKSIDECIALSANAMNQDQKMVAVANFLDIAMADGVLAVYEQELLETFLEAF